MVGQAVTQAVGFSGLRPFNPSRDLGQVALLLEQAFREDLGAMHFWSRVPILRDVGAHLWAASFAPVSPDSLLGFVWQEGRQIIGNVTLTPDESRRRHWLISNVAVDENYRRRGIARQMMLGAIQEAQDRGALWIILNVRPYNIGAIRLYEELGFQAIDTEQTYIRKRPMPPPRTSISLRRIQGQEHYAALELARAGMSERLSMFRPLRPYEFGLNIEDRAAERITDFFIGQSTQRWGYFQEDELRAVVTVRGQRIGTPHSFDIRVHPKSRGQLEHDLLAFALNRLARFPQRDLRTHLLTSHTVLVEELALQGFIQGTGLMLMAKQMETRDGDR